MQRQDSSATSPEPGSFPDLSLLFSPSFSSDDLFCTPGLFREGPVPPGKPRKGTVRYADELVRFFGQFPVRRIRETGLKRNQRELKWSEARRIALSRDFSCCQRCGTRERDLLTVHHIFPRGIGGGNDPGNLVTLCETCHQTLCRHCSRPVHLRVSPAEQTPAGGTAVIDQVRTSGQPGRA